MKFLYLMANFFAKYSVRRWNRSRFLRVGCRLIYYVLIEICYHSRSEEAKRKRYYAVYSGANTYPKVLQRIAQWPEGEDGIVVDIFRFVIRRSPSYCAYKIRELTGHGPKILPQYRHGRRKRYDARDWQEFLRLCGYDKIVTELEADRYYIGIDPDHGEFGQLYWISPSKLGSPTMSGEVKVIFIATTYEDYEFQIDMMSEERLSKLTVVEIG